ncbi:MAG TPA: Asp-tRNA(Asn)/Glu-tRNA(Gln) amidotransferase subunit GatB [Candidatus Saccharimonadales bacterium]|nr:Asp-tRNA(Asn)/Glu-tRNA(Gln) amidotransferase subunit GatB [Candidatus Saccharimonadales bacterium]
MSSQNVSKKYIPTIGIECHVQLRTATKLFAAVSNDARDAAPNTLVSHICFGLPGALPVLNREAVHLAIWAAFALNTAPQRYSEFERKHYFYPDLPMGYQISQLHKPIIIGGSVPITVNGQQHEVRINRVQLEADAGKSTHPAGKDYSLVDLNRAGTPLLEIVSEADMHSSAEAKAYVRELYLLMRYADVSDCDLYWGNMRFDVNVSISDNPEELGIRTETKNINSFRNVEKAVDYEIQRQTELKEKGLPVTQETRGWDDAKQRTFSQRTKEEAQDYRYMPDPDLPPVVLDEATIEAVRTEMPVMPEQWRQKLARLGLDPSQITTLLEADLEKAEVSYLLLLEEVIAKADFAKALANWLVNFEIPLRRDDSVAINDHLTNQGRLAMYLAVFDMQQAGKLNSTSSKQLLMKLLTAEEVITDVAAFAAQHNLIQESDEGAIAAIVSQVLAENPKAITDIQSGEIKVMGFLVGQVMKHSQGRANPQLAQELIQKQLADRG